MKIFQSIVAAITLLAVAANPVVAMAMPCCCTKPIEQRRSCCQTAQTTSSDNHSDCCAEKPDSNSLAQYRADCCCVTAPLTSTSAQENAVKPSVEKHSFDVMFLVADDPVPLPTSHYLENSPSRFSLSGPSLLALYCIWLE